MIRHAVPAIAVLALVAGADLAQAQQSNAGDIPDSQVFVDFHSPLGFSLKVPEGWAQTGAADTVSFVDHYDRVAVQVTQQAAPPTPAAMRQAPAAPGAETTVSKVAAVDEPGGKAVMEAYSSTSAANAVTGKSIALENERYLFWKGGRLATLTLSAPKGADNVDQWRLMSRSFRWN